MGLTEGFFLTVVFAFCAANSDNIIPTDKEVVYNYHASIRAGTLYPEPHASLFTLNGKLHFQTARNVTRMRITDLKYKIYNGVIDPQLEKESKWISISHEDNDLHKPFEVSYGSNGNVIGIATNKEEKDFSRNIKKAIASVFQLDIKNVLQEKDPRSFRVKEKTVTGEELIQYNVMPQKDGIEVHKIHDSKGYKNIFDNILAMKQVPLACDADFRSTITKNTEMKYTITDRDDYKIIKYVESDTLISYKPYEGHTDDYFVSVKQMFDVDQIGSIKEIMQIEAERFENQLTYKSFDESSDIEEITNGRRNVDFGKIKPQVLEMIDGIREYLNEIHINTEKPDIRKGQLINRIQRLLRLLDLQQLQELHSLVKQKLGAQNVEIYYKLLPIVGTRASATFIKELVINKIVKDDIAFYLIQKFSMDMVTVPKAFLPEMEALIHLDEKYSDDVRRVAILSFGTLVHKSYQFHIQMFRQQREEHITSNIRKVLQKEFEKYVIEYVQKIRDAKDFRTQSVYLDGLGNMRLNIITEYLTPALKGEWSNNVDFRSKVIITMASTMGMNPDSIFEKFWPIFSNRDEPSMLRINAHYFMMKSNPGHSRIVDMQWILKNETDSELYHFHYTYVKAMANTNEPCYQDRKLIYAQILDYLPPATHGTTSTYKIDYFDSEYKFSEGFEIHYVNDQNRQFLAWLPTQHLNRLYRADYTYIRFNGFRKFVDGVHVKDIEDLSVEFVITKDTTVIANYYFDKGDLMKFPAAMEAYMNDNNDFSKQLFDITYNRYMKILIPTDMGVPVMFEDLQPILQKTDYDIKYEPIGDIMNIKLDARYQQWLHYRHGLSVYNPIIDVWQGIHRYHSYDLLLPIRFNFTIDPRQRSLTISWQKHEDPNKDIGGLKAHVTSMTVVKDDFDRGILKQSSPKSKQFHRVTNGKQYQQRYSLYNKESTYTGSRLQTTVFDSHYYVSPGSFQHQLKLHGWISDTKNYGSPIGHLWLSAANFIRYLSLIPEPGTSGIVISLEPNKNVPVTNIELTMQLVGYHQRLKYTEYPLGHHLNTHFTYVVKNKEQTLKTWNINASLEISDGHKIAQLKAEVTRIIPGQKDYKICIDGIKKYGIQGVSGQLNVILGQTVDNECSRETEVEITMKGVKSQEQVEELHKYEACNYPRNDYVKALITMECLAAQSSVRKYEYNIRSKNVPTEFKKTAAQIWDHIKAIYYSYYTVKEEHEEKIDDDHIKVDVLYPVQENEVEFVVTSKNRQEKLQGMRTNTYLRWFGISPDSTIFPRQFFTWHAAGLLDHCVVHADMYSLNEGEPIKELMPNDWTIYLLANNETADSKHVLYVKQMDEHKIAIKMVSGDHVLEVIPQGTRYQITVDGQATTNQEKYHGNWVAYKVFKDKTSGQLVIWMPKIGLYVEYDTQHVVLVTPERQNLGRCFD